MDYLSLCLICKDENDYLPEWLNYHILMGVERFYIYDNESRISLRDSLADYTKRGWVVLNEIKGKGVQVFAYDHCLHTYGPNTLWMGFIDTDEFLVPKTSFDLKVFLKDYEAYGGLAVSSLFFGSGQNENPPVCGQIAGYTQRTSPTFFENNIIKCIVQPAKTLNPNSPHDFVYRGNNWCVNERFMRVDYQRFPIYIDKIQLNHYFCRSKSEIKQKLQRGRGDDGSPWRRNRFDTVNSFAIYPDVTIIERLQQLLGNFGLGMLEEETLFNSTYLLDQMATLAQTRKASLPEIKTVQEGLFRPEMVAFKNRKEQLEKAEREGNYAEVKRLELINIELMPYQVFYYVDLSICLLNLNEADLAWQALSQAWQLARNDYRVLLGMANYFLKTANYTMAEKTCRILMEMAPHELIILAMLTESLIGQERYEEAVKVGLPVIEVAAMVGELPEGMSVYLIRRMAEYLKQKKDYATLIHLWESVLKYKDDDADLQLELVKVLYLQGETSRADQLLLEVQQMAPQSGEVKQLLETRKGENYERQRKKRRH